VMVSPTTAFACSYSPAATRQYASIAVRTGSAVTMGKKTAWSIGNARKKQKKAKAAKPTAATLRGATDVKGFGITKEKLAKALGQMTAMEAVEYLDGPEPRQAGISEKVVTALRTEILNAVEAAKKAAQETKGDAVAEEAPAMAGPEDDSGEAMRKWRTYCAEALASAEKAQGKSDALQPVDLASIRPSANDVPLFKPRSVPTEAQQAQAEAKGGTSDGTSTVTAPNGFLWGGTF